jgi:pyruvate/2-oxoglutarate dehydrogenase complex dihydrolipoamide acyltransferase (E2) component
MARRMADAAKVPLAAIWMDIDAGPALATVGRLKAEGLPATFTAVAAWVVGHVLTDYPELGAEFDYEEFRYRVPTSAGVGVAVAGPKGLVVPVIQDAANRSLAEVTTELSRLVSIVRSGSVTAEMVRGGAITITNIGGVGIHGGMPIPNLPQNAILGISSVRQQAVVKNDEVVVGMTTCLTLTIDHRAIDGITAAGFLTAVGSGIEGGGEPANYPA